MNAEPANHEGGRNLVALAERFSEATLAKQLNPAQLQAVIHPPKPLLVVAGAGSGKTRVITFRLARLLAGGSDARRVMVVTFTNKAAGELRERAGKLLGIPPRAFGGLWIGTFHSLCARLLRQYGEAIGIQRNFVVYDDDDQKRLMTRVLADLQVPERLFPVRQVMSVIDKAKNQGTSPQAFQPTDYFDDVVAKAYAEYEQRLRAANATDFGGLLMGALQLMMPDSPAAPQLAERFDHVLVDEFQDTNSVQYRLVRFLSKRTHSITVVGDEDQSIYKWRGADIRNILDFERDHPGAVVVKLEQNYRSTGQILKAANAIICRNTERREKRLFTEATAGDAIISFEGETERDEAEFVAATIGSALGEDTMPARLRRVLPDQRPVARAGRGPAGAQHPLRRRGRHAFLRPGRDQGSGRLPAGHPEPGRRHRPAADREHAGPGHRRHHAGQAGRLGPAAAPGRVGDAAAGAPMMPTLRTAGAGPDLGNGPRKKLAAFVELMNQLREAAPTLGVAGLAEKVLEDSGYRDALAAEASLEAEGRMENLLELVAQMREYEREAEEPSLNGFLERIALASDVDGYDPEKGAVSLMTVHTAKGLEFPWVFLTGLEENIFPHARSVDDDAAIEEERRLCYVAVTRAMRRLFLTRVRRRRLSGQELPGIPSRFLRDLPAECLELIVQPRPAYMQVDTSEAGPWAGRWNRDVYLEVAETDLAAGPAQHAPGAFRSSARGQACRAPAPHRPDHRRVRRGRRRRGRRDGRQPAGPAHRGAPAPPAVRGGRGARLAVRRRRPEGHDALPQRRGEDHPRPLPDAGECEAAGR